MSGHHYKDTANNIVFNSRRNARKNGAVMAEILDPQEWGVAY